MTSMFEIARKTGLAASTVAAILRGATGFRPQTRERVRQAADELGYRPNYLSKALAGGKSMTIGLIVGSYDPAILWKVQAIESAARAAGYSTYVVFSESEKEQAQLDVQGLLDRKVDGLIIYSLTPASAFTPVVAKTPTVFIDAAPRGASFRVIIDQAPSMRQTAEHLESLGHKRAVFIGTQYALAHPDCWIKPYQKALSRVGIEFEFGQSWCVPVAPTSELHVPIRELARLAARSGAMPTAILTCDDELAIAIVAGLRDEGLSVPGDVSVIGFDDHPIAAHCSPSLTTLRQPRGEVGGAAFALLHQLMNGQTPAEPKPVFEASLIVRHSTGPARRNQ